MKLLKLSLMIFCFVIFLASPSFPFNPFETNTAGFGPRVAGTRLGVRMSLRDIVRWRVNLRGVPFTLDVNSERIPGKKPSEAGSISILMKGEGRNLTGFEITSAARGLYRLRNESMKLPDLLAEIEKAGVETVTFRGANGRIKDDCISFTEDLRVSSVRIRKSDIDAKMTHEEFLREITDMYSLPEMRRKGNTWHFRNEREGWQITYHALGDGIFLLEAVITD